MILNAENGFTMIFVDSRPDCHVFRGISKDVNGDILINPSKGQVRKILKEHKDRPVILSGHGSPKGLFNHRWNGYIVDSSIVYLLREVPCIIGVWCYAGNFADQYGLKGFFTSMFISNEEEVVEEGFNATAEEIEEENAKFVELLNHLILNEPDMNKWVPALQEYGFNRAPFVRYNYEAMALFE